MTKIVILHETIKSIMVHKQRILVFALIETVSLVMFHWYFYHLPDVPEAWRFIVIGFGKTKKRRTELSLVPRIETFALPCKCNGH